MRAKAEQSALCQIRLVAPPPPPPRPNERGRGGGPRERARRGSRTQQLIRDPRLGREGGPGKVLDPLTVGGAGDGLPGYISPPKGKSWDQEPITLLPTRPTASRPRLHPVSWRQWRQPRDWGKREGSNSPVSGLRSVCEEAGRSAELCGAVRSSGSYRSSTSHRAFWKVPPGALQPSSFVAEPWRVTRRKSLPSSLLPPPRGYLGNGAGAHGSGGAAPKGLVGGGW
ncbi:uncharacterized protein LOC128932268 [Callithrix jacchus]